MTKRFPKYRSHDDVECFNCGTPLLDDPKASGQAPRNGQFVQKCHECGMRTWYDLKEDKE